MGAQIDLDSSVKVLFIDEEADFHRFLERSLGGNGYQVFAARDLNDARELIAGKAGPPQLIFVEPYTGTNNKTDISDSLEQIRSTLGPIPLAVLTSVRGSANIVSAVRSGAVDYICKPLNGRELHSRVASLLSPKEPSRVSQLQPKPETIARNFVFSNREMIRIHETAHQVAESDVAVLILGESGVGKDVVARVIHEASMRSGPFVKVNCAALPADLTESELFGCEKGAFTGAYMDRPGKFEFAHKGTIFLDEIAEFTPATQAKLLQVLQEGRFTRLGSNLEIEIDVRVVAATNRKLDHAIAEGKFRQDLFYRLNVVTLMVPPLRSRRDEIPLLADYFLQKYKIQFKCGVAEIPKTLMDTFETYNWPGNVRELENAIKRFLVLQDPEGLQLELEGKISQQGFDGIDDLTEDYLQRSQDNLDLKEVAKRASVMVEKNMIFKSLTRTNWNKWKAAKELKVSYKTLLSKIELYGIKPNQK